MTRPMTSVYRFEPTNTLPLSNCEATRIESMLDEQRSRPFGCNRMFGPGRN